MEGNYVFLNSFETLVAAVVQVLAPKERQHIEFGSNFKKKTSFRVKKRNLGIRINTSLQSVRYFRILYFCCFIKEFIKENNISHSLSNSRFYPGFLFLKIYINPFVFLPNYVVVYFISFIFRKDIYLLVHQLLCSSFKLDILQLVHWVLYSLLLLAIDILSIEFPGVEYNSFLCQQRVLTSFQFLHYV